MAAALGGGAGVCRGPEGLRLEAGGGFWGLVRSGAGCICGAGPGWGQGDRRNRREPWAAGLSCGGGAAGPRLLSACGLGGGGGARIG